MISETEGDREEPLPKPDEALEANIQKAIRFWNHPSLANISSEEKRGFLHAKGVTDAEIHKAWERIMENDAPTSVSTKNTVNATANSAASTIASQGAQNLSTPQYNPNLNTPGQHANMYPQSTYAQPPYYNSQYNSQYPQLQEMEEEGPLTLMQGASLVTLGGFVGLTAAAAARWLNGGDFELFPGPRYPSSIAEQRSLFLQRLEAEREGGEEEEDEDEDEEYEEEGGVDQEIVAALSQQKLIQQVESIAESVRANTAVQEKILKKLTSTGGSITDETMGFLRKSDSKIKDTKTEDEKSDVQLIWKELVHIQAELRSLNNAMNNSMKGKKSDKRLESTLTNLDNCIAAITKKILSPSEDESNTKPPSPTTPKIDDIKPALTTPTESPDAIEKAVEELKTKDETATTPNSIVDSIRALVEKNDATARQVGCQLLLLYVANLSGNPTNPRYRKIYTSNESFKKVDQLVGGKELLKALGFEEKGNNLEWLPDGTPEQESATIDLLKKASEALRILKSGDKADDVINSALAVFPKSLASPNDAPNVIQSSS